MNYSRTLPSIVAAFVVLLTVLSSASAIAQVPAVSVINQSGGNTSANTFGWEFTVGPEAITVLSLGFWDDGADGLLESHEVGIWDLGSEVLMGSTTVAAGIADPIDGAGWRYNSSLSAFELSPNTTYVIGAQVNAFAEQVGFLAGPNATNITPAAGIAAFVQGRFSSLSTFAFPNTPSGEGTYFGPNFLFLETSVPADATSIGEVKSAFSSGS
ncbi:hypothetical protein DRQ53_07680 [bacterium]|nr:MAG: hypothetical protein DRQ32_00545 [bacterium]RKZ15916.1 MAG: hypothetical protein DRQ53_07680 [bacterium]